MERNLGVGEEKKEASRKNYKGPSCIQVASRAHKGDLLKQLPSSTADFNLF